MQLKQHFLSEFKSFIYIYMYFFFPIHLQRGEERTTAGHEAGTGEHGSRAEETATRGELPSACRPLLTHTHTLTRTSKPLSPLHLPLRPPSKHFVSAAPGSL